MLLGKCLACSVCPGELFLLLLPVTLETVTAPGLRAPGNFEMVAVTHVRPSILLLCAVARLGGQEMGLQGPHSEDRTR